MRKLCRKLVQFDWQAHQGSLEAVWIGSVQGCLEDRPFDRRKKSPAPCPTLQTPDRLTKQHVHSASCSYSQLCIHSVVLTCSCRSSKQINRVDPCIHTAGQTADMRSCRTFLAESKCNLLKLHLHNAMFSLRFKASANQHMSQYHFIPDLLLDSIPLD